MYGEPGEQVEQVLPGHALGQDPRDGSNAGTKKVKLRFLSTGGLRGGEGGRKRRITGIRRKTVAVQAYAKGRAIQALKITGRTDILQCTLYM